jgi:hypothetical protein
MIDLTPTQILFLAGSLIYFAGCCCALWVRWAPKQTKGAEPLSRLDAREEEETITLDEPSPYRRN